MPLILGPRGRLGQWPELDGTGRGKVAVLWRNAQLLHRQVDDLLDLAKLDAGHMAVQYTRFDLAALLRVLASHFETVAEDRHIRYGIQVPDALVVETDLEKCERIVLNLLSNAFKFPPDGGQITLTSTRGWGPRPPWSHGVPSALELARPARVRVGAPVSAGGSRVPNPSSGSAGS